MHIIEQCENREKAAIYSEHSLLTVDRHSLDDYFKNRRLESKNNRLENILSDGKREEISNALDLRGNVLNELSNPNIFAHNKGTYGPRKLAA